MTNIRETIELVKGDLADATRHGYACTEVGNDDLRALLNAAERSLNMGRMLDSQYWAGAKAAWNASQSDDPKAAFEAIQRAYTGDTDGQ